MHCCQVDTGSAARNGLAWCADGSLLAVAGPADNIVLYDGLSWTPEGHLDDGHTGAVNCLQFSPNGAQPQHCIPHALISMVQSDTTGVCADTAV